MMGGRTVDFPQGSVLSYSLLRWNLSMAKAGYERPA